MPLQRRSTDHSNMLNLRVHDGEKVPRVQEMPLSPLACVAYRQQFHVKCARETQLALQRLRAADT